jgi:non-heme chloroperoxidase
MHRIRLTSFRAASASRREVLGGMSAVGLAGVLSMTTAARGHAIVIDGDRKMASIKTRDGTEIFYKDWGPTTAQPIVFHHGWPLSADDWTTR